MFVDLFYNGQAQGPVAEQLAGCRFDPGLLRPFIDHNGRNCVTVNTGRMKYDEKTGQYLPIIKKRLVSEVISSGVNNPVLNATSLRKDEWLQIDRVILKAARERLRAWADLAGANTFGGFNAMAKMVLEHETMSDPGEAMVDMDGLTQGRTDAPKFQLEGLPLPITHSDFWFSQRRLAVSRNTGTPLDTTMGEAAGRRVAEMIEKTLIGIETGISYGADNYGQVSDGGSSTVPKIWGYTNHPDRVTKVDLTTPLGTNPSATVADVLAMRDLLSAQKFYGPFMLYHSADWDQFMDNDYYILQTQGAAAPSGTLRQRLQAIEGINGVRRLDFFSDTFSLLMIQMTADVARAINGMPITTVQWESVGGMQLNFKVMAIQVPQIRSDYDGNSGICHATTS